MHKFAPALNAYNCYKLLHCFLLTRISRNPTPATFPSFFPSGKWKWPKTSSTVLVPGIEIWNATWTFGSHGPANWDFLQKAHFQNPARAARV